MDRNWWRIISVGVFLFGLAVSSAQARCPATGFKLEDPGIKTRKENRQETAERYRRRAAAHAAEGRFGQARKWFARSIDLDPLNACAVNGLAWLLITCPDPKFRKIRKGLRLSQYATEMRAGRFCGPCWDTRAVGEAKVGDLGAAHLSFLKSITFIESSDHEARENFRKFAAEHFPGRLQAFRTMLNQKRKTRFVLETLFDDPLALDREGLFILLDGLSLYQIDVGTNKGDMGWVRLEKAFVWALLDEPIPALGELYRCLESETVLLDGLLLKTLLLVGRKPLANSVREDIRLLTEDAPEKARPLYNRLALALSWDNRTEASYELIGRIVTVDGRLSHSKALRNILSRIVGR